MNSKYTEIISKLNNRLPHAKIEITDDAVIIDGHSVDLEQAWRSAADIIAWKHDLSMSFADLVFDQIVRQVEQRRRKA